MVVQMTAPHGGTNSNINLNTGAMSSIGGALEQAVADYERLSASLSSLLDELAAGRRGTHLVRHMDRQFSAAESAAPSRIAPGANKGIRVQLLGPFKLYVDGREICADMPGQLGTVLKFIISQGKRVTSREALTGLLWPEADPDIAARRLRVVIHTLRKNLLGAANSDESIIVTLGTGYTLNPNISLAIDTDEFEMRRDNGRRMYRAGHHYEAFQEYERAASLYMGDFLEDEPYADWTSLRRESLRDSYASVLSHLAAISLEWEDYTGCIIWAQKLLAQDNCNEDAYRLLIESHQRQDQRSRAFYWYDLCVRTLDRELGLQPSAETRALVA